MQATITDLSKVQQQVRYFLSEAEKESSPSPSALSMSAKLSPLVLELTEGERLRKYLSLVKKTNQLRYC